MRSSKRYFALLFLLFALAFAGVNQTNYVQAKETTQKICLYLGQKITLADLPEGEVVLSKEHVVEVSANKVVTTIGAGTVTISVKTKAETVDYAEIEVKKNEILSDLSFNRQSFTAHPLGLSLIHIWIMFRIIVSRQLNFFFSILTVLFERTSVKERGGICQQNVLMFN